MVFELVSACSRGLLALFFPIYGMKPELDQLKIFMGELVPEAFEDSELLSPYQSFDLQV